MRGGTYARIGWCLRNTTMPFSNNKCNVSQIESTPVPSLPPEAFHPAHPPTRPPNCLVNADRPFASDATSGPCPNVFGRTGLTLVAGAEHYSALASVHMLRVVAVEARLREALDRVDARRVEVHLDRPVPRRLFHKSTRHRQCQRALRTNGLCGHVIQPQTVTT